MGLDQILRILIIGLIAGWLASQILKTGHTVVANLIVGVVGSMVGSFLFGILGIYAGGLVGEIVCATVGAIAFIYILKYLRKQGL